MFVLTNTQIVDDIRIKEYNLLWKYGKIFVFEDQNITFTYNEKY